MKFCWRLIWAELKDQPGRMGLGIFAMLISICLIIWMMGSYDALVREFDEDADAYMGTYDLCVSPINVKKSSEANPATGLTNLKAILSQDVAVECVHGSQQMRLPIGVEGDKRDQRGYAKGNANAKGTGKSFDDFVRDRMGIPSQSPLLVGCEARDCPYQLKSGIWPDMAQSHDAIGVLGSASAQFFKVGVGDRLLIRSGAKVVQVTLVGIVNQSQAHPDISSALQQGRGPALASLFVPHAFFESLKASGQDCTPFTPDLLSICLKEGVDKRRFIQRWERQLSDRGACFADTEVVRQRLADNRSVRQMRDSAQSAVGMVLFSCIFIIFTTLSMGVQERVHRLSLLRALGVSKRQIAGLVFGESLLLSLPAMVGGLLAGWGLLAALQAGGGESQSHASSHLMASCPSWMTIGIAFGCSLGGGLIAAILPAWKATRYAPMEAGKNQEWSQESSKKDARRSKLPFARPMLMIGLFAWCIQPAVLLLPGLDGSTRKMLFTWLGYPGLLLGVVCLAPVCVWIAERLFTPVLARCFRLHPALLKMQLTSHLAQSAGTAISLTVGLGLFIAVQIWGYSMLVPFMPDRSMPGTLISMLHVDYTPDQGREIIRDVGLDDQKIFPIWVEEPDLDPIQLASPAFKTVEQKSVVVAGIPLHQMMDSPDACFNVRFIKGNREDAMQMLKSERAVLIPDTFANATNLKPGDVLRLCNPSQSGKPDEWRVAGVVNLPGWHWLTKTSGMRVRRQHFIAALLIADGEQVRNSFQLDKVRFFWGNLQKKISSQQLQTQLESLMRRGQKSAEIKPMVKVTQSMELKRRIGGRADSVIDAMSYLPLIALAIASLAVMNAIVASVRTRQHAWGIMRSVGLTRWGVVRLVWIESILMGGASVLLSLLFGTLAAWGSIEILRYGYFFGGVTPPLSIPWGHLAFGVGMTLVLCWIASLAISIKLARRPICDLLDH
ncbi:MAG: ABC transporter permease [Akkermansia sp.]